MRRKFCCDASRHLYEDYYMRQSGSGLPIFVGSRGQAGHGLGSTCILSGFFRSAFPMLKRGLATFGKHALKTGLEIADDMVQGETLRDSAKKRVPEGIKRFATSGPFSNQSGSGRVKRIRKRQQRTVKRRRRIVKRRKVGDALD